MLHNNSISRFQVNGNSTEMSRRCSLLRVVITRSVSVHGSSSAVTTDNIHDQSGNLFIAILLISFNSAAAS